MQDHASIHYKQNEATKNWESVFVPNKDLRLVSAWPLPKALIPDLCPQHAYKQNRAAASEWTARPKCTD
jgi:hypothetical protein